MIQQTSLLAFQELKDSGRLGDMQKLVYNQLRKNSLTNLEIADKLNLPINRITPRTNELVRYGLVEEKGKKIQYTGRKAILWGVLE